MQRMTVQIADPVGSSFPDGHGWTVYANIDSTDPLDGYLKDNATGTYYYPIDQYQNSSGGVYNWTLTFPDTTGITQGDGLTLCVYDANNTSDFDSVAPTASQNGSYGGPAGSRPGATSKQETEPAGGPSIKIHKPVITLKPCLGIHTIPVTVDLTPAGATGAIFLLLRKYTGDLIIVQHRCLRPDKKVKRTVEFRNIDFCSWEHIDVVAVTRPNQQPQDKPLPAPMVIHDEAQIK
jgi:hypothetical protein